MTSTNKNLLFLQTQLNEYLHEHSVDADNTLWVTKKGIRLPYQPNLANLPENMKFVEAQLEKYLHEHEGQPDSLSTLGGGGGRIRLSSNGRAAQELNLSQRYLIDAIDVHLVNVNGTVVGDTVWITLSTGAEPDDNVFATSEVISTSLLPSDDGSALAIPTTFQFNERISLPSNKIYVTVNRLVDNNPDAPAPWWQFDTNNPYSNGHYWDEVNGVWVDSGRDWDFMLTFNVLSISLFITNTGFRFPYEWNQQGAIEQNMHYLETQISKYLHAHEGAA